VSKLTLFIAAACTALSGCGEHDTGSKLESSPPLENEVNGTAALPADSGPLKRYRYEEACMGTRFRIEFYGPGKTEAERNRAVATADEVFAIAQQLHQSFTDYDPESELMQLCRKPVDEFHAVSTDLGSVLSVARTIHDKTHGRFDFTTGHLTKAWRRAGRRGELPSGDTWETGRLMTNGRMVEVGGNKTEGFEVSLDQPGMLLDLGGIGKGYAADRLLAVLVSRGFPMASVAAGGDVRVGDPPPGKDGWTIHLHPFGASSDEGAFEVSLANQGVSTSGDTYQFVEIEGKRYSHIINPRTGIGIPAGTAVTVIAPTSTLADPIATALCVAGPDQAASISDLFSEIHYLVTLQTGDQISTIKSPNFPADDANTAVQE